VRCWRAHGGYGEESEGGGKGKGKGKRSGGGVKEGEGAGVVGVKFWGWDVAGGRVIT
jgi:hypothetical protein